MTNPPSNLSAQRAEGQALTDQDRVAISCGLEAVIKDFKRAKNLHRLGRIDSLVEALGDVRTSLFHMIEDIKKMRDTALKGDQSHD